MSRSLMRLLPCCLVLVGALLQPEAVEAQFGRRPGGFSGGGFSGGRGGGFSSRGRTGGGGGGGGLLGAAQRESVQAELKLTDEQKTQISEIAEAARANRDSFSFGDMRNASEEERAAIFADMRAKQEEQRKAAEEQLKGVLSPQQFQRLEQLSLHSAGVRGLLGESVATELKLTDEQKTQMEEILNAPPDADFRSMSSEEQEKWRADRDARVLAVLSDEQKQAWQAKLGPPPVELAQADSAAASSTTGASTSTTTAGAAAPAASTTEPPPGETVVSSFGGPSDSDEPHGPLETLSFNFRYAPWEDVLRLFADAAGLTLDLHDVPPGTFSYYDKNEYTPTEALDALNGYLLPKGYLLVRRNNFLVSLNIDNGIPPNLVPVVRPSELEERGNNELLSVIIPLPGTDAQKVSEEVGALIGPQGKVVALTSSNSLFVQDIGSNLRRIRDLIEGMEGPVDPEALTFKSFALKYIPANDAERHIRSLFGLQAGTPNVSSGSRSSSSWSRYSRDSRDSQNSRDSRDSRPEPPASASTGMTVASDLRMNSLLVTATPTELKVVEQILQSLDVPEDPDAAKIGNSSVPTLRVYTVREADPREVTKTLDAIMPGVVVNEDGRNGFIHIRATAAEHVQVEDLIRRLDGQGSQMVDIIRLSKFDPLAMSSLLNNLFVKDGENAPTIHAELQTRTLLVRGSAEQITQVRKTLQAYGEDGTGGPAARQGGRFRSIPLAGRDPERLARMVETILNGSPEFTNEIRVVVPNEAPVDRPQERVPSATERPPRRSERDANQDAASRSPLPPRNSRRAGLTLSPDDDDDTAADVVLTTPISTGIGGDLFAESQDARETQQTAPADDQQADGDSADDESDEAENSPTRQTNPAPVASPAAPEQRAPAQATQATPRESSPPAAARPRVSIEVRGDDLFLYSADEAALDQVEDLIGSLAEQITPRNTWTVFYLRVANAADVASMLQQLMPDSFVTSTGGTDSSFLGSMSALGGQLLDLAGMGGAGAYPTSLRIVTDARTNALYVTGPVSQVRDVEQFLKILDTSELPGSLRARVPRTIDVLYADVNEIAAMIREIYKDFLEDPAASQRNRDRGNPLAAMFGGGGAVSTNNDTSRPAGIRLTLAVDARTNQLIVSCDDSLFREIEQLVAERDRAAYDAEPTVRIVTLDDANMTLVQQALTTLSPKIVVSTSGSRSPSQPGQASTRGPSSTSSDNRPGDDDMLREMFRQRMMERAREGGGDSGSRSAGPPSGGSSGGNGRPSFRSGGGAPSSGGFRGSSGGFRGSSGGSRGSSRGGR